MAAAHPTPMPTDPPLSRASSTTLDLQCAEALRPTQNPVGASLLAKAAAHPTSMPTDPPLSRASSLPPWICRAPKLCAQHETLWERACSRRRQHTQHQCQQTHRYREQARPHPGSAVHRSSAPGTKPCGSEPAREGGSTPNINANRPTAIASKLAPTWFCRAPKLCAQHKTLWERACSRRRRHIQH